MKKVISKAKKITADRLVSISPVHEGDHLAIYYHFSKNDDPKLKEMKIEAAKGEEIESLIPLYAQAELFESEATELYGIKFKGNPSSGKRLFLEEK